MKFFPLTILLAFAVRSARSDVSWAVPVDGLVTAQTSLADMVKQRNAQATDTQQLLRQGDKGAGAVKGSVPKGSASKQSKVKGTKNGKEDSKGMGMMNKGKNDVKGMKKSSKDVKGMGMNKGGGMSKGGGKKKGNEGGGPVAPRRCADNQNNLVFTIFPDRENPIAEDVQAPALGFIFVFDGDFIGIQTQTILVLANGVIANGQDSFVFFEPDGEEAAGSIAVSFGNNIPVITGGTGLFLGADGAPVVSTDNEFGVTQLSFDICVTAV
jgi:hypothetical protein